MVTTGSCGTAVAAAAAFPTPISPAADMSTSLKTYNFGTPTSGELGDSYRLCWAAEHITGLEDYVVEIDGSAELHGPRDKFVLTPSQDGFCSTSKFYHNF